MDNKIGSVEEERKLVSIIAYIDKLDKIQITEENIDEIRNNLVSSLKAMILPLCQDVVMIKNTQLEIDEIINDEVWDDIYDDSVTLLFRNHMTYSKNYDLKKEQVIRAMAESMMQIFQIITNLGIKPRRSPIREDENAMEEDERQALKNRATRLIVQYKKFKDDPSVNKMKYANVYAHKLYKMADTEERFEFINYLFFEITGEYVLDKIRKKSEKTKEAPKPSEEEPEDATT